MPSTTIVARSLEDSVIFYCWAFSWCAYAIGGLYILGPVLAIFLLGLVLWRAYTAPVQRPENKIHPVPLSIWLWLAAMLLMLISLVVAHFYEGLGIGKTIKSSIGWAKGWLLLFLFPLAGACLNVRLETLCRANGWLALWMLLLTPILLAASIVGLPERLFVSPLMIIGGSGAEYFTFFLYTLDPENGSVRLQYTAPWAPAAGLVANLILVLGIEDKRHVWRLITIAAAVIMVMLCQSRMSLLCMLLSWPMAFFLSRMSRGWPPLFSAVGVLVAGFFSAPIISKTTQFIDKVNGMRAGSNRVRGALNNMAVDRWWTEAKVWGHGIVERGPHHVEYMPIGSHHTWFGLLFIKGAVGFVALAVVMIWTTIELVIASQRRIEARAGLSVIFIMWFFSFSENLEMLAYLYWPGLVLIGIGLRSAHEAAYADDVVRENT